jgi:hypothetical protein
MRIPRSVATATATATVAVGAFALSLGVAQAAVPLPSATSGGSSEVTFGSATLSGTVIPGGAGSDTKWCFEYGAAGSAEYNFGSLPLLPGDAGEGTSPVAVSVHVSDLQPGSTYRYRLVAVDALGTGLGSKACGTEGGQESAGTEQLFTTPSTFPAPQALTGAAGGVSQNAATISGSIDPSGIATSYEFQLGLDTSYGAQIYGEAGASSEPQTFSLPLAALQPETTYHYRIVAISRGGTIYGTDATFRTSGYPSESVIPPPPTPLVATPLFAFPTGTAATPAPTVKKAVKKSRKKKPAKAHKASTASHRHTGNGRNK